ncbi:intercellular adhesion molecule 3 [Lepus europaeus]|uniref:intercellular adhesion molecule 3 n=1 Tax=Lepus europaeus TaxID=9983 RepID=UPI002B480337|nr:intercellular adhesion molecule 3 [Lepus europaeus]
MVLTLPVTITGFIKCICYDSAAHHQPTLCFYYESDHGKHLQVHGLAPMAPSRLLPGACWILLLCGCLLPPGVQGQEFPLRVEPQDPVLRAGESLLVNCSTDCPDSDFITLETLLSKKLVGQGQGWVAFLLSGVSGNSQILCSGYCNGSQVTSTSHITVYGFPDSVELAPLPLWQPVGEDLTLRCRVVGGQPRARLSVLLLRGEEELSRQPALGEPAEVTATVRADRSDHGANFSCVTELDLRPLRLGLLKNVSAPRQLQTFVLPLTPPSLAVFPLLEVGTSWPVVCHLSGLFPASAAQVRLALGDQMLNPQVTRDGDALNATATVTERSGHEGAREAVCSVTLAGRSREARKNVTVYSFLGPVLNLSEPNATEGSSVTVTCAAGARVQLVLDGVRAAAPGQPVHLQLNATERDDGRSFLCGASLRVDGHVVRRNRSARLRVLYGPTIDRATCPQHVAWRERTTHVLHCEARGNPAPQLRCLQEGSRREVPVGVPFFVQLNYSGTYRCQAASPRGTDTLVVVVDVQGMNSSTVSIVLGVLATLGLVTVAAASLHVFGVQKRSGSYPVKQPGPSLPLQAMQPEEGDGGQPS